MSVSLYSCLVAQYEHTIVYISECVFGCGCESVASVTTRTAARNHYDYCASVSLPLYNCVAV